MQYLHEEQYYIDIYDLLTIKDCLEVVKTFREIYQESLKDKKTKDIPKEEKLKGANQLLGWKIFTTTGERYRRKAQRIEEMVEDDRKKQDFYDSATEPSNIKCKTCGKKLFSETKIPEDYMDTPIRVLYFFPCKTCKKKRGIYNTGEEFESKPQLCPKCKSEIKETHIIKGKDEAKIIIWKRKCTSCKFEEEEIDDFAKKRAEWKKKENEDKQLLEKYREEFCLSKEKGEEYIDTIEKMKYAYEVFEEEKQKYDNTAYQQTSQIKKLSINDLEKLLSDLFKKEKYIKLSLERPDIGQFVIVPFTAQDSDSSRKGHDSTKNLDKLLKTSLEGTNWRLLSNSLSYRLGYVSGQLKGYEREEDILKLYETKQEQKPPKDDYERRMKYGSDNYVQLSRMMGKNAGIENMRKRRLEKEPDGFFLEPSDSPYSCSICGENRYGNEMWWNLDGIRCIDCWRNIQEGVIPSIKGRYDDNKGYYLDWQLSSDFSLHSATIRKLKKEGLLRGRELKKQDGAVYCTVYLEKDNKEFLKKYPKKPKMKIEWRMKDNKGQDVIL